MAGRGLGVRRARVDRRGQQGIERREEWGIFHGAPDDLHASKMAAKDYSTRDKPGPWLSDKHGAPATLLPGYHTT